MRVWHRRARQAGKCPTLRSTMSWPETRMHLPGAGTVETGVGSGVPRTWTSQNRTVAWNIDMWHVKKKSIRDVPYRGRRRAFPWRGGCIRQPAHLDSDWQKCSNSLPTKIRPQPPTLRAWPRTALRSSAAGAGNVKTERTTMELSTSTTLFLNCKRASYKQGSP